MLAISDVNSAGRPPFLRVPPPTQWHTNHAPSLSPIIKPPDPFLFLSSPHQAPLFLKKKKGAKRPFEVAKVGRRLKKESTLRLRSHLVELKKKKGRLREPKVGQLVKESSAYEIA